MQVPGAIQLTDQNFTEEISQFSGIALVDFWAVWCGPCRQMTPIITQLVEKYKDEPRVKIAQLNVDEAPRTQQQFMILSIPTFIVFKAGHPFGGGLVGTQPMAELDGHIQKALAELKPA